MQAQQAVPAPSAEPPKQAPTPPPAAAPPTPASTTSATGSPSVISPSALSSATTGPPAAVPATGPAPTAGAIAEEPKDAILPDLLKNGHEFLTKHADISLEMWKAIVQFTADMYDKVHSELDLAEALKKEMDKRYGQLWHCAVGISFASSVSYEPKHFIHFYCDRTAIVLWRSWPDQREQASTS